MASTKNKIQATVRVNNNNIINTRNTEKSKVLSLVAKLVILLSVITFAVYANTLKNGFVLDDVLVIKQDTIVKKGVTAIPQIFSTPYLIGSIKAANDHYKPLSLAMFAIEYQLSDGSPLIGHIVNVFFFIGCVIFLFLFLDDLFEHQKTTVAFIASLLYALHPVNTEVVANIKSRDQLLCFFFGFFALNLYIRYIKSGKLSHLFIGVFLFFLSLISKETTITFLAVIPLVFFFYKNENRKGSIYIIIGSVTITILFLLIRQTVLNAYHIGNHGDYSLTDNPIASAPSFVSRIATALLVMGDYLKLLIIPYPLVCDYSYRNVPFVNFSNIWVLLSLAAYIVITFLGVYLLIRNNKSPFAFALLFFLLTISIFTNIIILIGAIKAERFLFFSSVGFCLVIALFLDKWVLPSTNSFYSKMTDKRSSFIIIPLIILYAVLTIKRNTDWADNYTLYSKDIKSAPDDARLYFFLGSEQFKSTENEENDAAEKMRSAQEGLSNLRKSLSIYPGYREAQLAIANGFFVIAEYDSAEKHYKSVLNIAPNEAEAVHNLAGIYFIKNDFQQALELCKKVVANNPNYMEGYNHLAVCYMHLRKYDSAVNVLKHSVVVDRFYKGSYENLALAYQLSGMSDSGMKYQIIAQQFDPTFRVY